MSLLDDLECTEKEPMSPEEEARLKQQSTRPCPYCSCSMTVGEDDYLGCCHNCWNSLED